MTELLLVRHGESLFNAQERWVGWEDESPLTAKGVEEAQALAERLATEADILAIYSSPLQRAWQTAQFISKAVGLPPIPVPGLREINVGRVAGLTQAQFALRFPEYQARWKNRADLDFTWPGGEKRADFFRRAASAVGQIINTHPHGKVLVVCHGGVIRATLAHYLPQDYSEWWAYSLHTASLTRLSVAAEGSRLLSLNEYP